jgi:NADPH-dependent 2,4-dienoyl-CoA reductase/sulfur reductase-like enzyme
VLATVDPEFGRIVGTELENHEVKVAVDVEVSRIEKTGDHFRVTGSNGFDREGEMVLFAVGVKPITGLGVEAGLKTGSKGALVTNRRMESEVSDVYVAGDCGETWHRLLNRYTYLPLGTTAHKQGRTAGENAVGGDREFAGSLGTQVVKVFDLVIARTGLRHHEALREGLRPYTVESTWNDHKAYYPGASPLSVRITGDAITGKLLGAQVLGRWGAEISKRLDIFAAALFYEMNVEGLSDLDLSYTPPLSSPWDPVQMAAHQWSKTLNENRVEA